MALIVYLYFYKCRLQKVIGSLVDLRTDACAVARLVVACQVV